MDFFTHLVVSVAIASFSPRDEDTQRAFVWGGIAPDFDVVVSWLPILIPELYFLQHRGLFHTIFFAPVVAVILIGLVGHIGEFSDRDFVQKLSQKITTPLNSRTILTGFFGSMIHLLMDWISVRGVVLFYPLTSTRYSLSVISVFDPIITLLSAAILVLWLYSQYNQSYTFSFPKFVRYSRIAGALFAGLLIVHGSLLLHTLTTQSPSSSTPAILPIYRWTLFEDNDRIIIHYLNQLTQEVEKSYSYPILTFNRTLWSEETIEAVIEKAQKTLDYKAFEFQVDPETRLVYEVEFIEEKGSWKVSIINALQDAQRRYYRIPNWALFENEIVIGIPLF